MKNKLLRALSVFLTVTMLLSLCNILIYAERQSVTREYYVSSSGLSENSGLTYDAPLPTVAEAVAKADDLIAGDNIIVHLIGETANTGDLTTEYEATLTVQSADINTKTTLLGRGNEVPSYINGPTVFKNVILKTVDGDATRIYNGGFDVVFDSDVEFATINIIAANGYNNLSSKKYSIPGQTITFNNAITSAQPLYIPNVGHYNGTTYTDDFNLLVNNATAKPLIKHATNGSVNYKSNLNYFIKKAESFTVSATSANNTISILGAVQVLINSSTAFNSSTKANLDAMGALAKEGYYFVTVSSAVIDALTLTETAGKYAVANGREVKAVNNETLEEITSSNGYISLTKAGEWSITEYFPPIIRNYYVDSTNGSDENNGLTVDTPVTTVEAVISKASDLDADDTIIANLIGSTANMGAPEAHTAKLVIQSNDQNTKTTLAYDTYEFANGPTVYKNITLSDNDASKNLYLIGKDVTIESDVSLSATTIAFATYNSLQAGVLTTTPGQYVVLKQAYSNAISVGNSGHFNNFKFTDDTTLVIDNASSAPTIQHHTYYPNGAGQTTTNNFLGDFNYYFKNAQSVNINAMQSNCIYNIDGAFQVLINKNTSISEESKANLDAIGNIAAGGYFYLSIDDTANIDITKTAGVYKIAENYTATAVNNETLAEIASDQNNELVLSAGEWTVTVTKAPVIKDYYVMNGSTGDGRTKDNPAATVYDVIASVNEDLQKGDTANVNIMNRIDWNEGAGTLVRGDTTNLTAFAADGGALPTHEATLVIQGYSTDNSEVYLAFSHKIRESGDSSPVILSGPTVFKNIRIICMRDAYDPLQFNGNDVTFEETAKYGVPAFNSDDTWNGKFTSYPTLNFKMGRKDFNWHEYGNDMTVTFNNAVGTAYSCGIFLPSQGYEAFKLQGDFKLVIDNPNAKPAIYWGSNHGSGVAHFYKNVNIHIKSATSITNNNQKDEFNIHGALQQIIDADTEYTGTIEEFSNVTVTGGTWKIINASTDKELLDFTTTAGTYRVKDGYQAVATNTDGTVETSKDGLLELAQGEWTVTGREQQTTSRSEYINYRRDLSNSYAKLVNDDKLNVVYFGGSVTNGYGGPDFDSNTLSWRAKIGAWLQSTFPNARVNNYNKACGESGTFLGSYRLVRDVLSCEPDLLFLEYSINDNYDYATYERASLQYETIVRQVREKYPTCDIVTVLVTNSSLAEAARKENGSQLHIQAQAHEDIAAHYDIPTLHVGRYLADSLPDNWTYENDWKGTIAYDTVHLLEKGNDIYYQVIKEYFNNCLVYGEYDAQNPIEPDGLPEMVNDKLLDGNITFIQPSAELIARSEELGGSGFAYNPANYTISGYSGILTVDNTANDPMLAIEFNGTELIALMHNYPSGNQFNMKIDDGEWQAVEYYHMNPQTLVTGLEAGTHTVYFKPTFTDAKTWQWIGGIYSRDDSQATQKGTGPITKSYYVMNGGTGDGRTYTNPAPTVDAVIPYINADGLNEDDTANIYIMQRDDWATIPEGKIGTGVVQEDIHNGIMSGSNIVQPHFMTTWSDKGGTLSTAHTAKIVIKSYDSNNPSYLAMSQYLGLNANVGCAGPTQFDDVTLVYTRDQRDTRVQTNYYDVTFTKDFKAGYVACSEYRASHSWDGKVYSATLHTEFGINPDKPDTKFTVNSAINRMYILHGEWREITRDNDIEIEINCGANNVDFYWGSYHTNGCTTTINGDVRFNIKSAGDINNILSCNGTNKGSVILNGTFQYIYNGSATLKNKPSDLFVQVDETTPKGVIINGDSWFIKNNSGYADVISYTSEAGTYNVDSRYEVIAENNDTFAIIESSNGKLILPKGNWTITAEKIPVYKNYYVKNGGTGDGRTPETPAGTVKQVIDSVNADLVAGDIANIFIMQREDYNSVTGMTTGTVHNFTCWTTMDLGTDMTEHSAKIVVKPYDPTVTTYLTYCDKYWTQASMTFGGDTEFENIVLVDTRGNYDTINVSHRNVKFGSGVQFGVLNTASKVDIYRTRDINLASAASGDQRLEILNPTEAKYWVAGAGYNVSTRTGDITLIFDSVIDTNRPVIYWGIAHSSSEKTHKGNINIMTKNAFSLEHSLGSYAYGIGTYTIDGAVQLITRSDVVVTGSPADYSDKVTIRDGLWDITYVSDAADALDFTNTTGQFKVKNGYVATAIDVNGNKTGSVDGILTLNAGKYTVYVDDEFTNTGEEITVNKDCEIDLSTVSHSKLNNKLFVGWKNAATGEYAEQIANYSKGDILQALYIDYDANTDFYYEEAMTTEDTGLRFIFSENKTFYNNLPEVLEVGAIVLPTDEGGYYDLFLDEAVVTEWQWDESTGYNFTPLTTGKTPTTVTKFNVLEETEDTVKYTVCVTDLSEDKYATYYNAKGYIKYNDYNGLETVLYTTQAQSCLYKASAEANEKRDVDNKVISVSKANFNDQMTDYKSNRVLKYGSGEEDDFYNIYNWNGLNINDIVIDSGIDGFSETKICFIADPHFNYINKKDVTDGLATTLSSYRGRSWARSGWSIAPTVRAMNFANSFDYVVMGGDAVDYVSYGGLAVTNRVFTQRAINNNLIMVMGNHEGDELSQPDMPMSNILSLEERFAFCQSGWSNDVYYSSQIVNGEVMVIGLDNSRLKYWDSQLAPLQRDLNYARENGLPVLIFQHIPMLTMNPDETAYKFGNTHDTSYFGTAENGKATITRNMNTYTGYVGNANSDATTMEVYNLIRSNADIISGVFHGHEHCNMYTEIIGTDANSTVIPQHGIAGIHYSAAMSITIK